MLEEQKGLKRADWLALLAGIAAGAAVCTLSPSSTTDSLWFIALCGAIAVCSMILPGISGSFILLVLGKYDYIMTAISSLDWPVLAVFGLGCAAGLAAFTKLLRWLLSRWERPVLALLIGFTFGSLTKVWPWSGKAAIASAYALHQQGLDLESARLFGEAAAGRPDFFSVFPPQAGSALLFALAGAALVFLLERLAGK